MIEWLKDVSFTDWLRFFASVQATYSAVMVGAIFIYSFMFWKRQSEKRLIIICFTFSHLCLILCTSITLWNRIYEWGHVWYWMLITGYLIGDLILFKLWKRVIKLKINDV